MVKEVSFHHLLCPQHLLCLKQRFGSGSVGILTKSRMKTMLTNIQLISTVPHRDTDEPKYAFCFYDLSPQRTLVNESLPPESTFYFELATLPTKHGLYI